MWLVLPVAPFVGAWIEIACSVFKSDSLRSLRSSERGLKSIVSVSTPLAVTVAPFVGAWIEITGLGLMTEAERSLRSSERGLKFMVGVLLLN